MTYYLDFYRKEVMPRRLIRSYRFSIEPRDGRVSNTATYAVRNADTAAPYLSSFLGSEQRNLESP